MKGGRKKNPVQCSTNWSASVPPLNVGPLWCTTTDKTHKHTNTHVASHRHKGVAAPLLPQPTPHYSTLAPLSIPSQTINGTHATRRPGPAVQRVTFASFIRSYCHLGASCVTKEGPISTESQRRSNKHKQKSNRKNNSLTRSKQHRPDRAKRTRPTH